MRQRIVADVAATVVTTVRENTTVKQVARTLDTGRLSGVPVLDERDRVVGVVSDTDLAVKHTNTDQWPWPWWRRGPRRKAAGLVATDVMTRPPVTIAPDAAIAEAARVFAARRIRRLPVVDGAGRLVGIVSPHDLLPLLLRADTDIAEEITREVFERGLEVLVNPATVDVTVADGVVTLSGCLERRSWVTDALVMTREIEGVVDVVDRLHYRVDDTRADYHHSTEAELEGNRWPR